MPNALNAPCANGACADPWICIDNKCQCNRGSVKLDQSGECYDSKSLCVNHESAADRTVGDSCSQHSECRQPLQACIAAKCGCIEGAYLDAGTNQCLGVARCPFGTTPGKACRRISSVRSDFENVLNDKTGVKTDTCDAGQYCFTSVSGNAGVCCAVTCPLNTAPRSADCSDCPRDTHFCHTVSGNQFAFSVCCQRPCSQNEFNNTYVNQRCMPAAALNDRCEQQNQCDGSASMLCDAKTQRCRCRTTADGSSADFVPKEDALTQSTLNPPQSCRNNGCAKELSRTTQCYAKVGEFLLDQCSTPLFSTRHAVLRTGAVSDEQRLLSRQVPVSLRLPAVAVHVPADTGHYAGAG